MNQTVVEYDNLTPWTYPKDYGGATWYGWYAVYSQNRDSDALEKSNYRRILEDLQALNTELAEGDIDPRQGDYDSAEDPTVCDTSVNHWACGWAEIIYVHSSNVKACKLANEICGGLEDYAVYDESDWSELETEEQDETWEYTLRSNFSTALGRALAAAYWNSWRSDQRDGESDTVWDKRTDAAIDWLEDGADITPDDIDHLFRLMSDLANVYWEEGWIDVDRVVDRALKTPGNKFQLKAFGELTAELVACMGDAKYDHGIVKYIDPNQLNLMLA